jgi:imidazolonepropionase
MTIFTNIGTLYTPEGQTARRGREMADLRVVRNAEVAVGDDGLIERVAELGELARNDDARIIDCRGLVALPGFVDSHTHAVFMASGAWNLECARAAVVIRRSRKPVAAFAAR